MLVLPVYFVNSNQFHLDVHKRDLFSFYGGAGDHLHFPSPAHTVSALLSLFHAFHKTRTMAPGTSQLKEKQRNKQFKRMKVKRGSLVII